MKNRLLHIYCGDGKGKTTAATGLAVRAAGSGMRVLFARFLKNEFSGELKILDRIPEIEVLHLEKSYGFFKTLSEKEQEEVREMYGRLWNTILGKISTGDYDMLVIDEFMAAYRYGLIPNKEAVQFLKDRPDNLEVVLTGRDPSDELLELADYISEVKMVRHPFEKGIRARKGNGNGQDAGRVEKSKRTAVWIHNRKLCCGSSKGGSGNALFRGGNPPGISYDAERDRTVSGSRKDPKRK